MDQPGLDWEEHARALRGLERINAFSRTGSVIWPPIAALAAERGEQGAPVRVLEIAAGGGSLVTAIARKAAVSGLRVEVEGCDINPGAIRFAESKALKQGVTARFFILDALHDGLPSDYDVVCCSLFLHHLDEREAVELLRRMGHAARSMVLLDDLVRSRLGQGLALVGCRLLSGSRIVHVDGPISIAAAFTPREALEMAEQGGLVGATVRRHWPQRFLLSWAKK